MVVKGCWTLYEMSISSQICSQYPAVHLIASQWQQVIMGSSSRESWKRPRVEKSLGDELEREGMGSPWVLLLMWSTNQNLLLQNDWASTSHQPQMIYQTVLLEKYTFLTKSCALFTVISLNSRCSSQFICISFSSTQDNQRLQQALSFNQMPDQQDQQDSASTWKGC